MRLKKKTQPYSKAKKRTDLNNQFFRSTWEANYARFLNLLVLTGIIHHWEYEPDEFCFDWIKRGTRFYKPDFKIFFLNGRYTRVEVKGYMNNRSIIQLKRFTRAFPKEPLSLVRKHQLKTIYLNLKRYLSTWEHK